MKKLSEKKTCGCDETWTCPEHRPGADIPVKKVKRSIVIPPYWKGFLEAMGIMGILFLILKILESPQ